MVFFVGTKINKSMYLIKNQEFISHLFVF